MAWFFQDHKWKVRHSTKSQATSRKSHAPIFRSLKQQAQPEVASDKLQASSTKRI
jgi:hypothetical protein